MTHRDDDEIPVEIVTGEPEHVIDLKDFLDGLAIVLRGRPAEAWYDTAHSIAKL